MLKKIKWTGISLLLLIIVFFVLRGCSSDNVGDVSLGIFTTKDIKIEALTDPEVPGVTCHISNIVADLNFTDPSDSSISCRQTGEITHQMLANIDRSKGGEQVFKKSQSILFKSLKINRIYDESTLSLIYIAFSTQEFNGNYQHSMSTVPLWGTEAYQSAVEAAKAK
ncbi:catabolite regulation protein CreA [Psychromonas sp. RZ22]|uniref:CreA family protein n=1 Tax=Psychromonas algarum TaxID=2555643 RepID=UPI0010685085|nr:CreA family protein [Psychromonas sp. RZ22]TEW54429.1 catabolite regulation protein CreA [Psychromonas sp. RZ22]